MDTLTHEAETVNPDTIVFQQDITFLPAVAPDSEIPAEVEPTGPTAADEAWWAEHAADDDDADAWVWELGPEPDPEPDYAVLMAEAWTLTPGALADLEHCPGLIG